MSGAVCKSNVLLGSSYMDKSLSLELGDGDCELGGLLLSCTSNESSSSSWTAALGESSNSSNNADGD